MAALPRPTAPLLDEYNDDDGDGDGDSQADDHNKTRG